jgi:DNA-binding NarL/FixJ family response regulator
MFNDQLAKIEKAKAEIAAAEAKLATDRVAALAKLPSDYGYENLNAFIKAVKAAYGKGGKAAKGKPGRKPKAAAAPKAAKKGKRAKITDEVKAQVKALAEAGKTGQEIAKALGISAPSVQNIKKALGMVKPRGTVAAAEPAAAAPAAPAV